MGIGTWGPQTWGLTVDTPIFPSYTRRSTSDFPAAMENEKGEIVDLYVPRKCSATNRIIKAKDHASVQLGVGKVDENGRYTGGNQAYALCGFVRSRAESDDSLDRLELLCHLIVTLLHEITSTSTDRLVAVEAVVLRLRLIVILLGSLLEDSHLLGRLCVELVCLHRLRTLLAH